MFRIWRFIAEVVRKLKFPNNSLAHSIGFSPSRVLVFVILTYIKFNFVNYLQKMFFDNFVQCIEHSVIVDELFVLYKKEKNRNFKGI
jgi:hypothetical protein